MARSYRQTASYLSSLADSRRVLVLGGDDDGSYGVWAAIRGIAPQDFNIMPADFAKLNNNVMVFYNTLRYNTGRRAVLAKDEQLVAVRDHCSLVIYTFPVSEGVFEAEHVRSFHSQLKALVQSMSPRPRLMTVGVRWRSLPPMDEAELIKIRKEIPGIYLEVTKPHDGYVGYEYDTFTKEFNTWLHESTNESCASSGMVEILLREHSKRGSLSSRLDGSLMLSDDDVVKLKSYTPDLAPGSTLLHVACALNMSLVHITGVGNPSIVDSCLRTPLDVAIMAGSTRSVADFFSHPDSNSFPFTESHCEFLHNEVLRQMADVPVGEEEIHLENLHLESARWPRINPFPVHRITVLNLSGNCLKSFPRHIESLQALSRLNLANNMIEVVPSSISSLPDLAELDLSCNNLTSLPVEVGNITHLRYLDVRNNNLNALPYQMHKLRELETLRSEGNACLVVPPREVLSGSVEEIRSFMRKSVEGEVGYRRLKLMVLGHGNVGKSKMLEGVTNCDRNRFVRVVGYLSRWDSRLPTVGADVGLNNHIDETTSYSVWDFAGQLEYLTMHEYFMSPRNSIYLVVSNLEHDIKVQQNHLRHWLTFLAMKMPNVKEMRSRTISVILVGTHVDKLLKIRDKKQMRQRLQECRQLYEDITEEFGTRQEWSSEDHGQLRVPIVGYKWVSGTDDMWVAVHHSREQFRLKNLREFIAKEGCELLCLLPRVPVMYKHVAEVLEAKAAEDRLFLPQEELAVQIQQPVRPALEYLDHVGAILWHPQAKIICLRKDVIAKLIPLFVAPAEHLNLLLKADIGPREARSAIVSRHALIHRVEVLLRALKIRVADERMQEELEYCVTFMQRCNLCFPLNRPEHQQMYQQSGLLFPMLRPTTSAYILPPPRNTDDYKAFGYSFRPIDRAIMPIQLYTHLQMMLRDVHDPRFKIFRNATVLCDASQDTTALFFLAPSWERLTRASAYNLITAFTSSDPSVRADGVEECVEWHDCDDSTLVVSANGANPRQLCDLVRSKLLALISERFPGVRVRQATLCPLCIQKPGQYNELKPLEEEQSCRPRMVEDMISKLKSSYDPSSAVDQEDTLWGMPDMCAPPTPRVKVTWRNGKLGLDAVPQSIHCSHGHTITVEEAEKGAPGHIELRGQLSLWGPEGGKEFFVGSGLDEEFFGSSSLSSDSVARPSSDTSHAAAEMSSTSSADGLSPRSAAELWRRVVVDGVGLYMTTLTHGETNPVREAEFERVEKLFMEFVNHDKKGAHFQVEKVEFVYNPILEGRFSDCYRRMRQRELDATVRSTTGQLPKDAKVKMNSLVPHSSFKFWKDSDTETEREWRQWILSRLEESVIRSFGNENVNLMMAWHGNYYNRLLQCAANGPYIGKLPNQDDTAQGKDLGYFGNGFYLTSYPSYSDYYIKFKKQALSAKHQQGTASEEEVKQDFPFMLSFVLMGKVFPIIEDPFHDMGKPLREQRNYHGKELQKGFDSHYTLVNKGGTPVEPKDPIEADEIVVRSKAQVLPRYFVHYKRIEAVVVWIDPNPRNNIAVHTAIKMDGKNLCGKEVHVTLPTNLAEFDAFVEFRQSLLKTIGGDNVRIITNRFRAEDGGDDAAANTIKRVRSIKMLKKSPILIYCFRTNLVEKLRNHSKGIYLTKSASVARQFAFFRPVGK